MKKKLIGIFVCMLLIIIAIPVTGINIESKGLISVSNDGNDEKLPSPWLLIGADQRQLFCPIDPGCGYCLQPDRVFAQAFRPSTDKLTAVALKIVKCEEVQTNYRIFVSIRDDLYDEDLTSVSVRYNLICHKWDWKLFDFPDIDVEVNKSYYVLCWSDKPEFEYDFGIKSAHDDLYDRGMAWYSGDGGKTWERQLAYNGKYNDLCFVTYWKTPRSRAINIPFLNFLQMHPNLFPILRLLLQRLGLQ